MKNLEEFDYLKELEDSVETYIPSDKYVIARLDGHGFSKFTKGCIKPFDTHLKEAMVETTIGLMVKFRPTVAYQQSDEITLIWSPRMDRNNKGLIEHPHSGRVVKLATLMSSYCSLTFAETFKYTSGTSYTGFDARVYGGDVKAAIDSLRFRFIDAASNAYQQVAQSMWSQKELQGVSVQQIKTKLSEAGVDVWKTFGAENMLGTFFFKVPDPVTTRGVIVTSDGAEMMKQINTGDIFA